ncbi:glycosyltransferase family 4 protein [Paraglaciecola sp.]|uniref:glycosyltransferase family 4 protein n=1 Tax=Paraglaciecola sp. TaxID=1920173 RepID=UPI00273D8A46|nr:glycosyltransferase family 4 protein [Paraglaciecola sp.]MDP5032329.1 glycosyltransferase family 4 protein [Paraglaciecola sp.]
MRNKIKKVLHLTYDMRIGGTEMVIKNLIESSDPRLLDMSIYCIEEPIGPWGVALQKNGIQITAKARDPGFDISLIFAIRKHIKNQNIDVLHCHQYTPWIYGVLAAWGTKIKVIFTEHGRFYPDTSSWKRRLINPWLCRITDHITSISQATKNALIEFENIPQEQIKVIYNGISALQINNEDIGELKNELGISDSTKVLGTIARLDPIKNHEMMLEAFKIVNETHYNTVLIIVGDGETRQKLEEKVAKLDLKDKVFLTGFKPQPANYLGCFDIYLLSSLSEGTSMTLLEAMSIGKACVVTDAGGNKEVIKNGDNGLVTLNDDAKAFASSIKLLLADESLKQNMSKNAIVRFKQNFTAKGMNQAYENLYRECE